MAKVTYEGPHSEVHIAELSVFVKQGESVDVPAAIAKELTQAGFTAAKAKKSTSKDEE
jgi:hypothetical protein